MPEFRVGEISGTQGREAGWGIVALGTGSRASPSAGSRPGAEPSGIGNHQKKDVSPRKWGEQGEFRHCSVTLWLSILFAGT